MSTYDWYGVLFSYEKLNDETGEIIVRKDSITIHVTHFQEIFHFVCDYMKSVHHDALTFRILKVILIAD